MKAAVALLVVAFASGVSAVQTLTFRVNGDVVHATAPTFRIIEGAALERLKDGRSIRIDLELDALTEAGGRRLADSRQSFTVSFDLWEERFVATRAGNPPRSASLARAVDADAWCIGNVAIPVSALARRDRKAPFWLRLGYRIFDPAAAARDDAEPGFTLMGLIDKLSRKRAEPELAKTIEAGPFRLN